MLSEHLCQKLVRFGCPCSSHQIKHLLFQHLWFRDHLFTHTVEMGKFHNEHHHQHVLFFY